MKVRRTFNKSILEDKYVLNKLKKYERIHFKAKLDKIRLNSITVLLKDKS